MRNLLIWVFIFIILISTPVLTLAKNCGGEGQQCCFNNLNDVIGDGTEQGKKNAIQLDEAIKKEEGESWWDRLANALSPVGLIKNVIGSIIPPAKEYIVSKVFGNVEDGSKLISIVGDSACPGTTDNGAKLYPSNINAIGTPDCVCKPISTDKLPPQTRLCFKYFSRPEDRSEYIHCVSCTAEGPGEDGGGIYTGLGCIYTNDLSKFITKNIFGTLLSIAALIAFFCILWSGIIYMTSRGQSEAIKQAQEMATSCVTGLIVIILSVFIMRVIGVDILQLPFLN